MKKILASILSAATMFSAVSASASESPTAIYVTQSPARAISGDTQLSKKQSDEVIAKLAKLVNIEKGYTHSNVSKSYNYQEEEAYDISIGYEDKGINASLVNGILVRFNEYDMNRSNDTERKYPKLTNEDCFKSAQEFVKKAYANAPMGITVSVAQPRYKYGMADSFGFDLRIKVNGISTAVQGSININNDTGAVSDLYLYDLPMGKYPKAEGVISADKAIDTIIKEASFKLAYMRDITLAMRGAKDNGEAKLYYSPSTPTIYVDAFTGEVIDTIAIQEKYMEKLVELSKIKDDPNARAKYDLLLAAEEITQEEYDILTGTGAYEMPSGYTYYMSNNKVPEGALSAEEIEKKARAIKGTVLTDDFTMRYIDYYKSGDKEIASMAFEKDKINVSISMDAKTGSLIGFYSYYQYSYQTPSGGGSTSMQLVTKGKLSQDKITELAEKFAKSQEPDYFKKLTRHESYGNGYGLGNFAAYTLQNEGIPFSDASILVGLTDDGLVYSYQCNKVDDVKFQSKDGILSEEALKAKIKEVGAELTYVDFGRHYSPMADESDIRLCYVLKNETSQGYMMMFDATTGKQQDFASYDQSMEYSDIEKSPNKEAIEKLAAIGIGFYASEYEPNKAVTTSEYLQFVLSTMKNHYYGRGIDESWEWENIEDYAASMGVIEKGKLSADKAISRIDAVVMLLKAHGYDKALKAGGIYKAEFSDAADIAEAYKGYAAMADSMGLIKLTDKKFEPNKPLTRGESAEIVYKFMTK